MYTIETTGPIFTRFYVVRSVEGISTICTYSSAQLNKMATMPIYGKTLKNLLQNQESSEAESWYISIGNARSTKFVEMKILGWHLTFLRHGQSSVQVIVVATLEECGMVSGDIHRWENRGPWASCLYFNACWVFFKQMIFCNILLISPENTFWYFAQIDSIHWRQFAWNVKTCYLEKNKKMSSICCLLN